MDFIRKPMEIEHRSMEIIAPHLAGMGLTEEETKVYSRIIHAAGDVEYAPLIRMHPEAIVRAQEALKAGCNIYYGLARGLGSASFAVTSAIIGGFVEKKGGNDNRKSASPWQNRNTAF